MLGMSEGVCMSGLGPWGAQCVEFSMLEITVLKVGKVGTLPHKYKKTHMFRVCIETLNPWIIFLGMRH